MIYTRIRPSQMIGMVDYPPLHSPEALRTYYAKFSSGQSVEPTAVIPVTIALSYFANLTRFRTYKLLLEDFLAKHPDARYFMLGGKHRSTAAFLAGKMVPVIVVSNDNDVSSFLELRSKGKITGTSDVDSNLERTLASLEEHFFGNPKFWTMEEKAQAMIANGDIPLELIKK